MVYRLVFGQEAEASEIDAQDGYSGVTDELRGGKEGTVAAQAEQGVETGFEVFAGLHDGHLASPRLQFGAQGVDARVSRQGALLYI